MHCRNSTTPDNTILPPNDVHTENHLMPSHGFILVCSYHHSLRINLFIRIAWNYCVILLVMFIFNSLWSSDTTMRHRSASILFLIKPPVYRGWLYVFIPVLTPPLSPPPTFVHASQLWGFLLFGRIDGNVTTYRLPNSIFVMTLT